ncbi:protein of unknown function [Pararobbsia alpina]
MANLITAVQATSQYLSMTGVCRCGDRSLKTLMETRAS